MNDKRESMIEQEGTCKIIYNDVCAHVSYPLFCVTDQTFAETIDLIH